MNRAIITSVHPYDVGVMVGSHHVARTLARLGWEVMLLSDPASVVHSIGAAAHQRIRLRQVEARRGAWQPEPRLTVLTPWTAMPLAGRLGAGISFCLKHWMAATVPNLPRLLKSSGFSAPDLLMFDGALYAPLLDHLRPQRTALRLFDMPAQSGSYPDALRRQEGRLAREVDAVLPTSEPLHAVAEQLHPKRVIPLLNACDVAHFETPVPEPADYAGIARPRVVYAGAIASWINQDLMNELAHRMPDFSFVWIGPGGLKQAVPGNVHVLGPKSYADLAGYLQHADVAVIPFLTRQYASLTNAVNPLKLYEYLAAGLPVVATPTTTLHQIGAPIVFAEGVEEFERAIRAAMSQSRPDPLRKAFVQRHTWKERVSDLLTALGLDARGI